MDKTDSRLSRALSLFIFSLHNFSNISSFGKGTEQKKEKEIIKKEKDSPLLYASYFTQWQNVGGRKGERKKEEEQMSKLLQFQKNSWEEMGGER